MNARRTVLALALLVVALLATALPTSSAQALGQRTQTWDTGLFKASWTVNFLSKHKFTAQGWLADTKCDGRGVYLDYYREQHRTRSGSWAFGPSWYVGIKDTDGCNNGRVYEPRYTYTAGDKLVRYLRITICSRSANSASTPYCYSKVWNNPYIDG